MKKTVIFNANHSAALYQFVVLKKKLYPEDDIILFINNINLGNSDFAHGLVENKIFNKIVCFCEPFDSYNGKTGEDAIKSFYDELFYANGLSINDVTEVITACDIQNWFGLYCVLNGVFPDFLEMHDNQFLDFYRYSGNRITSNGPMWVEELSLSYRILDGEDERVKTRYLCKGSVVKFAGKDIIIDFIEEFYSLPNEMKNSIVKAMNLKSINYSSCDLLLLNSFGWTNAKTRLSYPNHYVPYFLMADYYLSGNSSILFKDHPQTNPTYFNDVVSKKENVINSIIPIEFLGLIDNFRINKLLSVNSTGNDKISRFVETTSKAGDSYLLNFRYLNKLYVALMLEAQFQKSINFHIFGIDHMFIKSFIDNTSINFRYENILGVDPSILKWNIMVFIGDVPEESIIHIKSALRNADLETKVIFINDKLISSLDENDEDILLDIIPIKITNEKISDDSLYDFDSEFIYFFCKSAEMKQIAKKFTIRKNLLHTGISITADYGETNEIKSNTSSEPDIPNNTCEKGILKRLNSFFKNR